jgi:hypothetical protein
VSPAVKNPFYKPESGVLLIDDMAVDRLLAKGVIIGACNVALMVQSKMLSGNAGVTQHLGQACIDFSEEPLALRVI